jgi:soluble lytic murein transglycosylase-like protein
MLNDFKYLGAVLWAVIRPQQKVRSPGRPAVRPVFGLMALGSLVVLGTGWLTADARAAGRDVPVVDVLSARADWLADAFARVERVYERDVAPLERVLVQYRDDPALARRIAASLVREGRANGLEPRLLLAVLLVENPWLNPDAKSFAGATGLMQVMPLHRGKWGCGDSLEQIESNICYGARIFASYLENTNGNVERALLRYNGCVRGTNTPNCQMYPYHVFARAGRASILAWRPTNRAAAP